MLIWLASFPRSGSTMVRVYLTEVYGFCVDHGTMIEAGEERAKQPDLRLLSVEAYAADRNRAISVWVQSIVPMGSATFSGSR